METTPLRDRSAWWLLAGLVVVLGGFISIRVLAQRASGDVEAASDLIVTVSTPGIEALASLRASVFEIELRLSRALATGREQDPSLRDEVRPLLRQLGDDVQRYLALPPLPGAGPQRRAILQTHRRFHDEVIRTLELGAIGRRQAAEETFLAGVLPSGSSLIASAMEAIGTNAQYSSELAARVKVARRRAMLLSNLLTAFYVLLGIAGSVLAWRELRRRRDLAEARARFHEARAAELEQFAGRVAHDIRNPLSAAKLGADLLLQRSSDDSTQALANRIARGLARANAIIEALLDFARSGARPDPGARTDVREVVEDVTTAAAADAEQAGIELTSEPVPPVLVACSTGVYVSLLGNLLRNAIKYMGDAPTRKIVVRVTEEGSRVRTEVSDTGPGIRPEAIGPLFEPYFRATDDARKEGLGLGLATVKKLTEGHGGEVGVRSAVGQGSTFWFTLPRAGLAAESPKA